MSAQIVQRLLDIVNTFNLESRQTQAQAERRFEEDRLAQARQELRDSEDRMQLFLQSNRDFQNSPQLQFEQGRLQRDLTVRQQVVLSLAQSYEQARIAEVRNTPVITVVEHPAPPVLPDPRRLLLKGLLGLVGGALLGALGALWRDLLGRSRDADPDEFAAFISLRHAAVADAQAVWTAVKRPFRALGAWRARGRTGPHGG